MDEGHPVPTQPHSIPYQEEGLLKILSKLKFKSVLDVGASVGRIAKLILDNFQVETYHGMDLSYQRLCCAKSITQKYKGVGIGPDIEFYNCSYLDYYPHQKYDLVISTEVLMHIIPEQIDNFFGKMVKESSKHVVTLDYWPLPAHKFDRLAEFNFLHRYPDLYLKNGFKKVEELRVSGLQSIFHGEKE